MADMARASAPASIGNVGAGFDVLGQAFDAARDTVVAVRESEAGVRLGAVSGLVSNLPGTAQSNTALAAAKALLDAAGADFGVRLSIDKGIPLSAGMGGSAASAVAAVVAVNALLPDPMALAALLPFALEGERVSSDPPPWDNVAASLHGGLVIVAREAADGVFRLPAPRNVVSILFHPPIETETHIARRLLAAQVPMRTAVEHSRRIAAFVAGCATGDPDLLRAGLEDLLVEPQRGPAVCAWALDEQADAVEAAMDEAFRRSGLSARAYRAPVDSGGVRLEEVIDPSRRCAA
jgi:homoserine kinase